MNSTSPVVINSQFVTSRYLLLALYGLLTGIGLLYHEPWRDETHSWLIASLSTSLPDLFHNVRYEGHPMLWYLIAYLTKPFGGSFDLLQFAHWLLTLGAAYLLLTYAPFPLIVRVLLLFSYFLFYEYALIARNYAVGVLLLFLIGSVFDWRTRPDRLLPFGGLFALVFQTNVYALLIGLVLASVAGLDLILYRWPLVRQHGRAYALGATLAGLGLLAALLTMLPPADINLPPGSHGGWHHWELTNCVEMIWNAFVPLPAQWPAFRNTNLLELLTIIKLRTVLRLSLTMLVVGGGIVPLFRSRLALLGWGLVCFGMLFIMITQYLGSLRHHGHFALSALIFLWIQPQLADYQRQNPVVTRLGLPARLSTALTRLAGPLVSGVLVAQVLAGIISYGTDLVYPFTTSRQVADYMLSGPVRTWFWAGYTSDIAESVAVYLPQHRMYYPMNGQHGGFLRYDKSIHWLSLSQVVDSVRRATTGPALLIVNRPLEPDSLRQLHLSPVKRFTGSIQPDENYYLYRVDGSGRMGTRL